MSALQGTVDLPAVGSVDKRVLIGVGAVAAAFVGWRYWAARGAAAAEETPTDPGFEDGGLLPGVAGAVRPGNDYGLGDADEETQDDYGFTGKTNSQWTQYAAAQLSQGSDTWSYATIVGALGQYLANRPLTRDQVAIVQAAIAVAGYPPVGSFVIVPGGDTPILVAPGGLKGSAASDTAVSLSWSPVAGASGYEVYRGSAAAMSVSGTSTTVTGLTAATSYGFQVAAVASGGGVGPKSATVTVTTKAKTSTPTPTPTPGKPAPKPGAPAPSANRYPKRWKTIRHFRNSNYSSISRQYKLGISGTELYNYQFSAQAGRPEATKSKLRARGADLIYAGGSTVLPYPK